LSIKCNIFFVKLDVKAAGCEEPGVKQTQPSVTFRSVNKYFISLTLFLF